MSGFRIPVGEWATAIVDFVTATGGGFFDAVRAIFGGFYDAVDWTLATPPFWAVIVVFVALSVWVRGWVFGAGAAVGLLLIAGVDQWANAMDTLALTLVAASIAIAISILIGIWAAKSRAASAVVRLILDFLQTMPAFVYLIPAIILFRIGVVPGIVATIAFALAPGVRLTELGIRGVDREVIEAGHAFGSSPGRVLRQIQLPLAKPTIMAGVNQVIMLSLSMVVISSMVGAGGLGGDIIQALSRIDVGLGAEAGLAVVILAILLDRLTASLGADRPRRPRPDSASNETASNDSDSPTTSTGRVPAERSPIADDAASPVPSATA
jgi:glycine betaine/proline transport system substrate-binding protein